ncbi:MAG: hypothetical protein Q8Q31_05835 [Nanoarchaeota archaeon]|nr:hypothetical protein [Nanoarchaeota archaeon]
MSSEQSQVVSIQITKKIPFFGQGDTLENRLRQVKLRGFPNVKIYENANFALDFLTKPQIEKRLHTPQPSVYQKNLEVVRNLADLFAKEGIDILNLEMAYDFTARSSTGEETEWTMIPPIVERFHVPRHASGGLNYESLIGAELARSLKEQGLELNAELLNVPHTSESGVFDLINDGTHRIHFGYMNGGVKILRVEGMTPGYPYYAAPKSYSEVKMALEPTPETTAMKVHIVESPAQKQLYRLFPSGGIKTGEVRPPTSGENFV